MLTRLCSPCFSSPWHRPRQPSRRPAEADRTRRGHPRVRRGWAWARRCSLQPRRRRQRQRAARRVVPLVHRRRRGQRVGSTGTGEGGLSRARCGSPWRHRCPGSKPAFGEADVKVDPARRRHASGGAIGVARWWRGLGSRSPARAYSTQNDRRDDPVTLHLQQPEGGAGDARRPRWWRWRRGRRRSRPRRPAPRRPSRCRSWPARCRR